MIIGVNSGLIYPGALIIGSSILVIDDITSLGGTPQLIKRPGSINLGMISNEYLSLYIIMMMFVLTNHSGIYIKIVVTIVSENSES